MSNSILGIGNLFRLYGQQIRGEKRTPPVDPQKPSAPDPADMVQISPASKKLQIFRHISSQLIENLTSSGPQKGQDQAEGIRRHRKEEDYPGKIETKA